MSNCLRICKSLKVRNAMRNKDQNQKMLDFINTPTCVFLFTDNLVDLLYFVTVTENETVLEDTKDPCSHFYMMVN